MEAAYPEPSRKCSMTSSPGFAMRPTESGHNFYTYILLAIRSSVLYPTLPFTNLTHHAVRFIFVAFSLPDRSSLRQEYRQSGFAHSHHSNRDFRWFAQRHISGRQAVQLCALCKGWSLCCITRYSSSSGVLITQPPIGTLRWAPPPRRLGPRI